MMKHIATRFDGILSNTAGWQPGDWDAAVDRLRRASRSLWPVSRYRARYMLPQALMRRGDALGRPADIQEAQNLLSNFLKVLVRAGATPSAVYVELLLAEAKTRLFSHWTDDVSAAASAASRSAMHRGIYPEEMHEGGFLGVCGVADEVVAEFDRRYQDVVAEYERAIAAAEHTGRMAVTDHLANLGDLHLLAARLTGEPAEDDRAIGVYSAALRQCRPDDRDAVMDLNTSLAMALVYRVERKRRLGGDQEWRDDHIWAGGCLDMAFGSDVNGQMLIKFGTGLLMSANYWLGQALDSHQWAPAVDRGNRALAFSRRLDDFLCLWSEQESTRAVSAGIHDRVAYAMVRAENDAGPAPVADVLSAAVKVVEDGRAALLQGVLQHVGDEELADRLSGAGQAARARLLRDLVTESRRLQRQGRENREPGAELTAHQRTVDGNAREMLSHAILANRRARHDARLEARQELELIQPSGEATVFAPFSAVSPGHPLVYLISLPEERGLRTGSGLAGLALAVMAEADGSRSVRAIWLPRLLAEDAFADSACWASAGVPADPHETELSAEEVEELLDGLGTKVMEPLLSDIGWPERLTIVPGGRLGFLPLHAVPVHIGGVRYHLPQATVVNYAPSARMLLECQGRAARQLEASGGTCPSRLVAVADPYLGRARAAAQLPWAYAEVGAVQAVLGSTDQVLAGRMATVSAVRAALAAVSQPSDPAVVHLACHAATNPFAALDSYLLLTAADGSGGDQLFIADLLDQPLAGGRLIVLSACGTAVSGAEAPNEALSLAGALLADGASAVLATQCAVFDFRTAVVMARFYFEWSANPDDPAGALTATQRWLVSEPSATVEAWLRHEHPKLYDYIAGMPPDYIDELRKPISWAPFTLHGK